MADQFDSGEFFRSEDEGTATGFTNGHDRAALTPIDPALLADVAVPQRRWLVPGWIPMARATSLYGAGGEGKTLLAQMLATACAIGADWLGLPVLRCRSLLLFC